MRTVIIADGMAVHTFISSFPGNLCFKFGWALFSIPPLVYPTRKRQENSLPNLSAEK